MRLSYSTLSDTTHLLHIHHCTSLPLASLSTLPDMLNRIFGWAGYEWTRSPSTGNMSDTTSPVYPNRPIRPLPKHRIRSRLSDDQAKTIVYPSPPNASTPLFGFPQSDSSPRSDHHPSAVSAHATGRSRPNYNWPSEALSDDEIDRERLWSREYPSDPASGTWFHACDES